MTVAPPTTPHSPDAWHLEVDVVVVGYGYAGAVAAIEAKEAGADTLLIEKMPDPGGISITTVRQWQGARPWVPKRYLE